jgi:predicted nucleotide-binding protein
VVAAGRIGTLMAVDPWDLLKWMADRERREPAATTIFGTQLLQQAQADGLARADELAMDSISRAVVHLRRLGYISWRYVPVPHVDRPEPPLEFIDSGFIQRVQEIHVTDTGHTALMNLERKAGRAEVVQEPSYWHVIVVPTNKKRKEGWSEAVILDKDRAWVESRILEPRRRGLAFALKGTTFDWADVERLKITVSETPATTEIPRIEAEWRNSSVVVVGADPEWSAANEQTDVTDELIEGPPGTATEAGPAPARVNSKAVMVVHGRDGEARRAMFDFLRALKLEPLEWGRLIEQTGKATPYVGEVLEKAFEDAAAVVVLLTPDDEARLRDELLGTEEPRHERELSPQGRPNVLFEAGMAFGIHPDRTVLVELGKLRPFSDVGGRHVVRLDGTANSLREIARRLKAAGCDLDESGDDWTAPERFPDR